MCNSHDSVFPEYTFGGKHPVREIRPVVANNWSETNLHDPVEELHHVKKVWLETGFESLLIMTHSMTDSAGEIILAAHAALYNPDIDTQEDEWV